VICLVPSYDHNNLCPGLEVILCFSYLRLESTGSNKTKSTFAYPDKPSPGLLVVLGVSFIDIDAGLKVISSKYMTSVYP